MAKRGNNEGTIRKRPDGRWEARIFVDGAQRSVYGKTRDEVARKMREGLRTLEQGMTLPNERLTVEAYLKDWLETAAKPNVRPGTFRSYSGHVRLHIVPAIGKVPVARLTPQQVQKMLNNLMAGGMSASTALRVRATLRRALTQALRWGIVSRNAAALIDPPKLQRIEVKPLTPEQARQFLDAVRGDRLEALYYVALALGLRQGEILGLRWEDIDFDTETLRVRFAMQRINGEMRLVEPKTHKSRRTMPAPKIVLQRLREHRITQDHERLLLGDQWQEHGLVFTSLIGTPLDGCNVTHRFQRILRNNDLPRQRFHDLRHACATFLLSQGLSPRVVMETLGHSEIGLTMNTYAHVMPALQREAADRMDELLGGAG